jgi:O-acetylhomoserine (thiol)-lyase
MGRVRDETLAVHGGYQADSTRAVAVPIYQTVAHDFIDAAHAGAVFDLQMPGFHYNRINNPTVDVLEQRMTALETGEWEPWRSARAPPLCVTRSAT